MHFLVLYEDQFNRSVCWRITTVKTVWVSVRLNLHIKETYTLLPQLITPGAITKLIPIHIFQKVSHGTFKSLYHDPSVTPQYHTIWQELGWKAENQISSILLKFWQDWMNYTDFFSVSQNNYNIYLLPVAMPQLIHLLWTRAIGIVEGIWHNDTLPPSVNFCLVTNICLFSAF